MIPASVIARSERRSNPSGRVKSVDCFAEPVIGRRFARPVVAMTAESSPLFRRNIPEPCRMRGDILETVFQVHALVGRRLLRCTTRPAAIRSQAGSAAAQNRRRSSDRHCAACSRRSPHRRCTHRSRCALRLHAAAGPCRNIRSSVEVAAPWSSRDCWLMPIIANRAPNFEWRNPSISAIAQSITAPIPSAAASSFPSTDRARSRSAHAPRSGAASARC